MVDTEMLVRISGDPQGAMEEILGTYGSTLRGRLSSYASNRRLGTADVDDVLQDCFMSLLDPDVREQVLTSGGEILPWLSRRGYWRLEDGARRRVRDGQGLPFEDVTIPSSGPTGPPSYSAAIVETALLQMSPRDQDILRWHYDERATIATIAERLGMNQGAAKKAAHDARTRMKRRIIELGIVPQGAKS